MPHSLRLAAVNGQLTSPSIEPTATVQKCPCLAETKASRPVAVRRFLHRFLTAGESK